MKAHSLATMALAVLLASGAAAQEETAAEALADMIEEELEIGRALTQSPTAARRTEQWRRWRTDHDAELTILLALRREGVDLDELFAEYNRRRLEAGVSTMWQSDLHPGE
jgi:hypothetical protein